MFDGFTRREEQEKIRRIELDLIIREKELMKLRKINGEDEEFKRSLEADVFRLTQVLNMLDGPCCRGQNKNFFKKRRKEKMRSGIKGLNQECIECVRARARAAKESLKIVDLNGRSNGTIKKLLKWGRGQRDRVPINL